MSIESYRNRVLSTGNNIVESTNYMAKRLEVQYILDSPFRREVLVNDNTEQSPCVVRDVEHFKVREFLFMPDSPVFIGDYIHYDGFTYLATEQNTDTIFPKFVSQCCNFEIPIITGEKKVVVGRYPNGQPIYDVQQEITYIPCVFYENIYSSVSNSPVPIPSGNISMLIPFGQGRLIPDRNQTITNKQSDYKILDFGYDRIIKRNGIERGVLEIKLQSIQQGGE